MATRKSYTKPNSQSQKQANKMLSTLQSVLLKTGFTKEKWLNLFFELGYQLVQQQVTDEDLKYELLHIIEYGFWDWWLFLYLTDDEEIMNDITPKDYTDLKNLFLVFVNIESQVFTTRKMIKNEDKIKA